MEKMDPEGHEYGYVGRLFFAKKMWTGQAAKPFLVEHLKSLQQYPPRQAADTLSIHKALETAMSRLENPGASSN